jgi:acetoin:2,6-dichlorophenolindophenol oxidoreductase subunit alpha
VGTTPDRDALLRMHEAQQRAKLCDERIRSMMASGQLAWLHYHSPRGQECVSAGYAAHLRTDDMVVTTHRGLHDQIAKGVPLRVLWAELLGRVTETGKGKGGLMHLDHASSGLMLTTGIVGGGIPIANGLALAAQLDGGDRVTVCCFGDGAANTGAFHEGLNLAAVWQLPVVFVCQNNGYAQRTPMRASTAGASISRRASAYDMPAVTVDGNDAVAVYEAAGEAVDRARAGGGPTLVEAMTSRLFGHVVGEPMDEDPDDERRAASAADPVPAYRRWIVDNGHATEGELATVEAAIATEIDDAVEFALASPWPDEAELYTDVLAGVTA